MTTLIHEHHLRIHTPEALHYVPRTYAAPRADGMWEAWLEFVPEDRGAPTLRTERETTQASWQAVESWALGLEPAYFEGAFRRATIVAART